MSSSKVSAAAAVGAISVPTRVATGSAFTAVDRIDGAAPVGFSGYWRQRSGEDSAQGNFDGYGQGQDQLQPQFTPLVARRAAAFPASLNFSDSVHAGSLFGSDLLRAVGIYDFNMKLFARSYAAHGSVINRFS